MSDAPATVLDVKQMELDSDDTSKAIRALRAAYPHLGRLRDPGFGQCVSGQSLPQITFRACTTQPLLIKYTSVSMYLSYCVTRVVGNYNVLKYNY